MSEESVELLKLGWVLATVNDIGEYINGMAFKPSDWESEGRPIIRIQNPFGSNQPSNFTTKVDPKYIVNDGDIFLVSWSTTLDAYIWKGAQAVLNQHIFKVVHNPNAHLGFAFWVMKLAYESNEEICTSAWF